jgi:hypothetical protein
MNPVTALALGRIGVGVASLVNPKAVAATLGSSSTDGSAALVTQWFGSREIALGAATLLASGGARTTLVLAGMAVDGSDAATAWAALDQGTLPREIGLAMVGIAAGAVAAGALGLRLVKRPPVVVAE